MAGDDLFKRYLEIGASVLGMSRERAESIVRDLVASGEVAKSQATKAVDWLVERGRAGTEELAEMVRREIRDQIAAMGLATKDDVARLEAQLEELRAAGTATTRRPAARTTKSAGATKPAGIRRSASVSPGGPPPGAAPAADEPVDPSSPGGAVPPRG